MLLAVSIDVFAQGYAGDFWRNNRGNSSSGPFFGSPDAACNALPVTGDLVACGFVSSGSNGGTCSAYNTRLDTGCDQARRATGSASIVRNPPDCPEGQEWVLNPDGVDDGSLACDAPPEPEPDPGEECEGETDGSGGAIRFVKPGEDLINEFCTPFYSNDGDACQDVAGTINGHEICNDDKNECEAGGGTYGYIGTGDDVSTAICIPSDFDEDLPTCDISSVNIINRTDETGQVAGFACSPPITPGDPTDSKSGDAPPESDVDNDGIPDKDDPDIDGDGIPNSQDPDIDGDGIPNEDDGQTGEEPENSVSGGGNCAQAPRCQGDPVQCAILFQNWKTRCEIEEQNQTFNEQPYDPNAPTSAARTSALEALDAITTSIEDQEQETDPLGANVATETGTMFGALTALMPTGGACADITWNVFGKGNFTITCAGLAPLRDLLGWAFAVITIIYIINIAMQRTP